MIKTSDIVNKVFSKSFMGYDVREVDAFLDDLILEVESLQRERLELSRSLEALIAERRQYGAISETGSQKKPQLQLNEPQRRLNQPRRIAQAPQEEPTGLPEADIQEIAQGVALEIETGAAAPRMRVVGPEIRKVSQGSKALEHPDDDSGFGEL